MASAPELNRENERWRASAEYRPLLSSIGANPDGPLTLSDQQRKQLAAAYQQQYGTQLPKGVEFDPAGNLNENEGFGKQFKKWGPIVGGAALTAFGIPGVMPGLIGGGAAGGAAGASSAVSGAGGTLAANSIPLATQAAMSGLPSVGAAAGGSMGLLGGLGKIGSFLGKHGSTIADLGSVVSGGAKGSADQRYAEGNQALNYAQLGNQQARDQFSSDLALSNAMFGSGMQGAQFNREGQGRQQKQALLSALLGGLQDASITPGNPAIASRMPTMTGGLRPSALAGQKEALMALLAQPQIEAPTYQAPEAYRAPGVPQQPKAGALENILGGVGLGTSILGALGGGKRTY